MRLSLFFVCFAGTIQVTQAAQATQPRIGTRTLLQGENLQLLLICIHCNEAKEVEAEVEFGPNWWVEEALASAPLAGTAIAAQFGSGKNRIQVTVIGTPSMDLRSEGSEQVFAILKMPRRSATLDHGEPSVVSASLTARNGERLSLIGSSHLLTGLQWLPNGDAPAWFQVNGSRSLHRSLRSLQSLHWVVKSR